MRKIWCSKSYSTYSITTIIISNVTVLFNLNVYNYYFVIDLITHVRSVNVQYQCYPYPCMLEAIFKKNFIYT